MIGLRQFEQFLAVANAMSFRKAAERLNMAQPPLTAAIRRMEAELGVRLFERGNRVIGLTAAGLVLVDEAERTLRQAARAIDLARRAGAGEVGSIRVGFVASAARRVLPDLMVEFRRRHPEPDLQLVEATSARQIAGLLDDSLDVGIVVLPLPLETIGRVEVCATMTDSLILAIPAEDPLAGKDGPISLEDLKDRSWILFPHDEGPGLYGLILKACASAGFLPRVSQRALQMETTIGMVEARLGIALVPGAFRGTARPGVVFREIMGMGTPIPYVLGLVRKPSRDQPVVRNFIMAGAEAFRLPNP